MFSWREQMDEEDRLRELAHELAKDFDEFASNLRSGKYTWEDAMEDYTWIMNQFKIGEKISNIAKGLLGFAFLNAEAIRAVGDWIIDHQKPVFSIGAGRGLWEAMILCYLRHKNVDNPEAFIHASDPYSSHGTQMLRPGDCCIHVKNKTSMQTVLEANEKHLKKYALLTIWPSDHEDWAYEALDASMACTVFYVGEPKGGCTATDKFFDLLEGYYLDEYDKWCASRWEHVRTVKIPKAEAEFLVNDSLEIFQERGLDEELLFNLNMAVNFVSMFE